MTPAVSSRRQAVTLSAEEISKAVEQLKDAFLEYLEGNTVCEGGRVHAVMEYCM